MTQELANQVIKDYQELIEEVKEINDVAKAHQYLFSEDAVIGICNYISCNYDHDAYLDIWIKSFINDKYEIYWFISPQDCFTIESIVQSLQFRIDRLKTFQP